MVAWWIGWPALPEGEDHGSAPTRETDRVSASAAPVRVPARNPIPGAAIGTPSGARSIAHPGDPFRQFSEWLGKLSEAAPAPGEAGERLAEGLAIVRQRQAELSRLIRDDPEAALARAVSWQERERVPAELRPWLEEPFSETADVEVVFVCGEGDPTGLSHASAWRTTDGSVLGPGERVEYGNPFDRMGSGSFPEGYFQPNSLNLLNWAGPADAPEITAPGRYRLAAHDRFWAGPMAYQVALGTNILWLSYRALTGTRSEEVPGLEINQVIPGQRRQRLLDLTPGTAAGFRDAALAVGFGFGDPEGTVNVTTLARGGETPDARISGSSGIRGTGSRGPRFHPPVFPACPAPWPGMAAGS